MYKVTKTYGHEEGLSTCFRQFKTDSHCKFLHGYALSIKLIFTSEKLDIRDWVIGFGDLKEIKQWLKSTFDHRTLVAKNDPMLRTFINLSTAGLVQLNIVDGVGCENFAKMIHDYIDSWLQEKGYSDVILESVEVREHAGNSAIYNKPKNE